MNSISSLGKIKYFPLAVRSCTSDSLGASGWYPSIKPGKYPKTEEEKCAAAKKYGLLREEYEPYPDNGDGFGDYPKVKMESMDVKSNYYPWHYTYTKRLYSETLNVYQSILSYERYSTARSRFSFFYVVTRFLAVFCAFTLPVVYFRDYKQHHRLLEKQYPYHGEVHYTFDFDDKDDGDQSKLTH